MQNDPAYVRRLENLPPARRRSFLEGDWDAYDGQAFEEFNHDIHVVPWFPIPKHWRRWRSVDNGYTDPFAWYWFAVDEQGTVYIYREFTRDYHDPKIAYSEQARKVVKLSKYVEVIGGHEQEQDENIGYTVVGHDAFNKHPQNEDGKTIVDYYNEGGVHGCVRAITDRRMRKTVWHEYLRPYMDENTGKLTSRVKILSNCKKLIETLPQQVEDEDDPEKVAETNYDHWYDGAGYGLIFWHIGRSKAPEPDKGVIQRDKEKLAKKSVNHRKRSMRLA
jgi:hypothetical protein